MCNETYLTLYPIDKLDNWDEHISRALNKIGYNYNKKGRAWIPSSRKTISMDIEFADGFSFSPVRLGAKYHAIAINPHRFFFSKGSPSPIDKPLWSIISEKEYPRSLAINITINNILQISSKLSDLISGLSRKPVELEEIQETINGGIVLGGADEAQYPIDFSLGRIFMKHGLKKVPDQFTVIITYPAGFENKAKLFSQSLADAFSKTHIQCKAEVMEIGKAIEKLAAREASGQRINEQLVFWVGVKGQKGIPLQPIETECLLKLDLLGISYRLFSLDNAAAKWSAFDQTGILVQAAGGIPYSIKLPILDQSAPFVFLGLDLGHPRRLEKSWVVASLVDDSGQLLGYWRKQQKRDETLSDSILKELLTWFYLLLRKKYRADYRLIIMRDGRMFENENLKNYSEVFGNNYSFVEVIKNPVPLMVNKLACAAAGTMCVPENSKYFFLLTSRSKNHSEINLPLKINIVFDGLELKREKIAHLITGLCHAPTLGLNPTRSPAPIYWSNGLAAINETNHQFSGIHWVPHN